MINALLSRCRTYILESIKEEDIIVFLEKNMGQINDATNEQAQLVQDFSEIIEELTVLSREMKGFMHDALK